MIYLRANPLLREPLRVEHIKHRLLLDIEIGSGTVLDLDSFKPSHQEI